MNPSVRLGLLVGISVFLIFLLEYMSPVLMPFIVGAAIAYFLDPLVDAMEQKGMRRTWAVSLIFIVCAIVLGVFLVIVIPMLGHQLVLFSQKIPAIIDWFQQSFIPMLESRFGYEINIDIQQIKEKLQEEWARLGSVLTFLISELTRSSFVVLAVVGNMVLIPVVAFYVLQDWDDILEKIDALLPLDIAPVVRDLFSQINEMLSAFVRGQLVVMFCLGTVYSLGLWIVGIDMALMLGMLAGLASIVPYMGFAVGIVASFIAAWFQFQDPMILVWVGVVFGIGQALEGMVLTPMLVGDKIGLHPVAVIFAIMAGGQLFGFVGMLVALPVAASAMVLLRFLHNTYLHSELYQPGGRGDPLDAALQSATISEQQLDEIEELDETDQQSVSNEESPQS